MRTFALLHLSNLFAFAVLAGTGNTGALAGRTHGVVPINIPLNALNGSGNVAGPRTVHRRASQLCTPFHRLQWPQYNIGRLHVHNDDWMRKKRRVRPATQRPANRSGQWFYPMRHLESAFLVCNDSKHPAQSDCPVASFISYLQLFTIRHPLLRIVDARDTLRAIG